MPGIEDRDPDPPPAVGGRECAGGLQSPGGERGIREQRSLGGEIGLRYEFGHEGIGADTALGHYPKYRTLRLCECPRLIRIAQEKRRTEPLEQNALPRCQMIGHSRAREVRRHGSAQSCDVPQDREGRPPLDPCAEEHEMSPRGSTGREGARQGAGCPADRQWLSLRLTGFPLHHAGAFSRAIGVMYPHSDYCPGTGARSQRPE